MLDVSAEEYCALHLQFLNTMALKNLKEASSMREQDNLAVGNISTALGYAIDYNDMPGIFIDYVVPEIFLKRSVLEPRVVTLMREVATHYSKSRSNEKTWVV